MKTTPTLSDGLNSYGSFEIRWSEKTGGVWRSMRRSTKTGDRAVAELVLARFLQDRQRLDPAARHSVGYVVEAYLRDFAEPRGNGKDRNVLRAPLLAFGKRDPLSLTHDDIEDYSRRRMRGEFGRRKVAPATVAREISALQAALNYGSKRLLIFGKPTFRFDRPAGGPPRDKWLDEAQEREVLSRLDETTMSVALMVRMGLTYGVRLGAMMDLRFGPQISFITASLDFNVPGRRRNRKRRPTAPMTPEVRGLLERLFQERGAGSFVLERTARRDFLKHMEAIGYGWVTPHVLKHSAITLMLRAGKRPEDVAAATETSLPTILEVYRHHCAGEKLEIFGARRA